MLNKIKSNQIYAAVTIRSAIDIYCSFLQCNKKENNQNHTLARDMTSTIAHLYILHINEQYRTIVIITK